MRLFRSGADISRCAITVRHITRMEGSQGHRAPNHTRSHAHLEHIGINGLLVHSAIQGNGAQHLLSLDLHAHRVMFIKCVCM